MRVEDELKAKDEEIAELKEKFGKEEILRKEYEEKCVVLLSEKNDLTLQLQAVSRFQQHVTFTAKFVNFLNNTSPTWDLGTRGIFKINWLELLATY